MNKSKAKRLRKELEHEQRQADRGYNVKAKQIQERQRRMGLEILSAKHLTAVQKAVHFDEPPPVRSIEELEHGPR